MSRFATDTAVTPTGDGGYLAALVLRAIQAEVADPERRPRTLTLHYLRPPAAGPAEVLVTVERAGRGLTTVSARLRQDGRDCILALAALGVDRPGPVLHDLPAPAVPAPDELGPVDRQGRPTVPMAERYDTRPALGARPFTTGPEAVTGGWIRTVDQDPIDDVLVAAFTDAWPPAVFARLTEPIGVPTVELTIHFRQRPPDAPGWCLVRFETREAVGGYLEESGAVWSEDGRLLAQCRQLGTFVGAGSGGPPQPMA